jgi:heat shock protein HslJ
MPRRFVHSSLALVLLGLAACQTRSERPASSPDAVAAPTPQELANATYLGLSIVPDTVQLVSGEWEGRDEGGPMRASVKLLAIPPLVGDMTRDGRPDAVATLRTSGGGTGSWTEFAVMSREAGGLVTKGTAHLTDRAQIRALRLAGDTLVADVIEAGETDPSCCPGDLATHRWVMNNGKLEEVAHLSTGRLSSAVLIGTTWTLSEWNRDEPAPAEPAVQLRFTADGVDGQAGCNSFRGSFRGDDLTALTFGPLATTRKLCPPPQMDVETRFLKALAGVQSFGFSAGRLTLSVQSPDGMAWMTFTAAADTTH